MKMKQFLDIIFVQCKTVGLTVDQFLDLQIEISTFHDDTLTVRDFREAQSVGLDFGADIKFPGVLVIHAGEPV